METDFQLEEQPVVTASTEDKRLRDKGNAGRCTKKRSKYTYSKKRVPPCKRKTKTEAASSSVPEAEKKKKLSVSHSKLKHDLIPKRNLEEIQGYRLFDMTLMSNLINELACPECLEKNSLYMTEDYELKKGLASHISVSCANCSYMYKTFTSKQVETERKGMNTFDINYRSVYATRTLGLDHTGLEKICCFLNMPKPMTVKNFNRTSELLGNAAKHVAVKSMTNAVDEIRRWNGVVDDKLIDIGVTVDGTWQKRGFSSFNGVVAALSVDNGKVVDKEVMSRYCRECAVKSRLLKDDDEALREWKVEHKRFCRLTSMEPKGAIEIFSRSISERNARYTGFFGDGDSKAFQQVENIYGDDVKVKKFECIGHYQKRVGCRLRSLKKREKSKELKPLTDAIIDKLQNYFGIALRSNCTSVDAMSQAIMASLFHVCSSKQRNLHDHCMKVPNSWCQFQRDISNKTNLYVPGKGLTDDVIRYVKPIYIDLIKPQELARCLHGLTQNQNESFNSTIWERVPKFRYSGFQKVQFGAYDAVANFNDGRQASLDILKSLKLIPGYYTTLACRMMNVKRKRAAEYHQSSSVKKAGKIIRANKKKKGDKNKALEGKPYKSGGF